MGLSHIIMKWNILSLIEYWKLSQFQISLHHLTANFKLCWLALKEILFTGNFETSFFYN